GVRRAVAAADRVARCALEPGVLRGELALADRTVAPVPGARPPALADLVQAIRAVHDERALRAQLAQHTDHALSERGGRNAEQLPLHAPPVREGTEPVEDS